VALQKQELWRQLRDAEAVLPRPRLRRLWLIRRTASAPRLRGVPHKRLTPDATWASGWTRAMLVRQICVTAW